MKIKLFFYLIASISIQCKAQNIVTVATTNSSLRGLCVVNDKIIWTSGSNGTVGKSIDSGKTWKWLTVKGFNKSDFRDIEAFSETSALIMSVGEPAYILRTLDGGENWKVVFVNNTKGMFLDAMEFWNEQSGIVIGDPINNHFFIARTFDGGFNWKEIPSQLMPVADSGEACFAASGTNIVKLNNKEALFVTGGLKSRIFIRNKIIDLPIISGTESAGANSIDIKKNKIMIVVGGDYTQKDNNLKNCAISINKGITWKYPTEAPHGYRSCVAYLKKSNWITCGINGVDISNDDGEHWKWINKESYNVCGKAQKGDAVFLAGEGKVGKLIY